MVVFITLFKHFSLNVNHIRRICLIKTLLVKNPIGKPSEGKTVQYCDNSLSCSWYVRTVSLKTLLVKPKRTKSGQREKKYSTLTPFYKQTLPHVDMSWCIPILCIDFFNVEVGNDFVNKFARLSLEHICCTPISPLFWCSCL